MALTLSKINIANGNIIQAADVSQSIDAFTGTAAYDITLSGSLQLTGSVKSKDGFTGSLFGTAATASFVTLAQTASFVTLAQSAKILNADNVFITASVHPSSFPYKIDPSTPAMIYLALSGGDIGLDLNPGTVGQIITFNPYTTDEFIPTDQISITGSLANAYGYGGNQILFPSGTGSLENLFAPTLVGKLFSFSLHYTSVVGSEGWYLVNVSKAP